MTVRCCDALCLDGPPLDDEPQPRWAVQGTALCRRCTDLLERRIAELPARAAQVRAVLGGLRSGQTSESKRTKGSPPVPLNLDAHDLLEDVNAKVVSWVRAVCEDLSLRGPDRVSLDVLCPWLLSQLPWIVTQDFAREFADEMRDLARSCDGITRVQAGWHRLPVPCPGCDASALGRWDGASEVLCQACGERWPESEYTRLVLVLASDRQVSLDAAQVADRLGVTPSYVRDLVARGALRQAGKVGGRSRFDPQDVRRLWEERESA